MDGKTKGLEASIWASPWATRSSSTRRFETARSRSVPPEQQQQQQQQHQSQTTSQPHPQSSSTAAASARPNNSHSARNSTLAPLQAFQRFEQACHRLRWKYIDLQSSYARAMSPEEAGFTAADAERNFKVDFHEFYAWIEQALVLVLHVFGVVVSRSSAGLAPSILPGGTRGGTTMTNGAGGAGSSNHAFHHNVLLALEDNDAEPLREALARGETNQALWKAKELRNRWKDAAEGKETPPLKMYDLRWIVGRILGGLEEAYGVAAGKVESELEVERARRGGADGVDGDERTGTGDGDGAGDGGGGQVEDGWEWMVDSMDWEA